MKSSLNIKMLRRLADPRSFGRGEQYFNLGLVRSLSEYDGAITAKVKGTHTYTVKLRQDFIDPIVNRKDNQAYEEPATLLRKIKTVMNTLKQDAEFTDYLLGVRVMHKQKRNFMKLLDKIK